MRIVYDVWHLISRFASCILRPRLHAYLFDLYRLFILGEYWPIRRIANHPLSPHSHFLSVCAIIKDEASYLVEWIEFHRLLGVEKFYLYLNECSDDTEKILKRYVDLGIVEQTFINGEKVQLQAYNDCARRHAFDTEWLAFIDLDEFIVPTEEKSLCEILRSLPESCNQILLKWLYFGSNGHNVRLPGLVIERFVRRGDISARPTITKSIARPRKIYEVGAHLQFVVGGRGATKVFSHEILRVHHYFCKSWEEFARRATRGDVARGAEYARRSFTREKFDAYDLNDIEDLSAVSFVKMHGGETACGLGGRD